MLESKTKTSFTLPKLHYEENGLEPVISARTLSFHHGKHHAGYVEKLNELIEGSPYAGRPLDEVVTRAAKDPAAKAIFNNAAQAWNHDFYWRSMRPKGGGTPGGAFRDAIERDIGGLAEFRTAFAKAAAGEFGSGWAWLVADKDRKLKIATTDDADTPIVRGERPLLVIDVWEHAYYLDYQNRRPDYVAAWLENLVNWDFAAKNFGSA
jgi:Fe-Mn family superoxide dismutase